MSIAIVSHTTAAPGANGGTTPSINTTGASLLVGSVSYYTLLGSATLSDSYANTWTPRTASTSNDVRCQIYDTANPTVGSGHTFSFTGTGIYPAFFVAGFSGVKTTSPFDQETGATAGSASTVSTGSVTPGEDGELLVAAVAGGVSSSSFTINSSFTISDSQDFGAGNNQSGVFAYKVQTSAGAENPAISWTGSSASAARIATYKAASGGSISMPGGVASFTLTGVASNLLFSHKLGAQTGVFNATGIAAILKAGKKVISEVGVYTETGVAANLKQTKILPVETALYVLSGVVTNLKTTRLIVSGTGVYSLIGKNVTLIGAEAILPAGVGSYALAGIDASLLATRRITASPGGFTLTGQTVNLLATKRLTAAVTSFTATGNASNLIVGRKLTAVVGGITVTSPPVILRWNHILVGGTGVFTLTGKPVGLIPPTIANINPINAGRGHGPRILAQLRVAPRIRAELKLTI